MKQKRLKVAASLLLTITLFTAMNVEAAEVKEGVEIERNFTDDDKFSLEIRVEEGGYLIDGKARISKGTIAYELPLETTKTFQVQSMDGYEIKDIRYEQPGIGVEYSILNQMEANEISIQTVSTKIVATIEFEETKKGKLKIDSLATGDEHRTIDWVIIMLISGCFLIWVKRKKQEDTYKAK